MKEAALLLMNKNRSVQPSINIQANILPRLLVPSVPEIHNG